MRYRTRLMFRNTRLDIENFLLADEVCTLFETHERRFLLVTLMSEGSDFMMSIL
jgi:hypothetical protein